VSASFIERGGGRRGVLHFALEAQCEGGSERVTCWKAGRHSDREGAGALAARGVTAGQGATRGARQGQGVMKSCLGRFGSRPRTLRAGWPGRGHAHGRAHGVARRLALQSEGWGKTVRSTHV
jgi:hypothetical protein